MKTALKTLALSFTLAAVVAAPIAATARERHPEIHKAERALMNAKTALEHANHDFGGHRVKAIQAIDAALDELKQALESDKH